MLYSGRIPEDLARELRTTGSGLVVRDKDLWIGIGLGPGLWIKSDDVVPSVRLSSGELVSTLVSFLARVILLQILYIHVGSAAILYFCRREVQTSRIDNALTRRRDVDVTSAASHVDDQLYVDVQRD